MKIVPFKGYRFNSQVVGDTGICIAPPYDVIDAEQQEALYRQSDYNIVRISKGKVQTGDTGKNNVYTRAAAHLKQFLASKALVQDAADTIYVYTQEFQVAGQRWKRSGFIALGEMEEYGGAIKPHEQTLAGPKADRLNLLRATGAQMGQIFMLYSDPEKTVDALLQQAAAGQPLLTSQDDGVSHRLYAITDPAQIKTIQQVMSSRSVFIADGHHRYETTLKYYQETGLPAARWCMMTFINTHNEGLVILPTHRLIKKVDNFSVRGLLGQMGDYFDIARLDFSDIVQKKARYEHMLQAMRFEFDNNEHAFGMYFDDGAFYVATLRDPAAVAQMAPGKSTAWCQLDVAILHKLILEKMLGVDEAALTAETNVDYIKDLHDAAQIAIDRVDAGAAQALFFMNTTRAAEVQAVALAGEKMPQKSTFFYPKIFTGLVLNKVADVL